MIIYSPGASPDLPVHYFYNGTEKLSFDKGEWKWYRTMPDGSLFPLDGVTSVVKLATPLTPIKVWAVRVALARAKQLLMDGGYVRTVENGGLCPDLYEEKLDEIIASAKNADTEELEDAGDVGHFAHAWIESYIKARISKNEDRRHELLAKFPEDERAANGCVAALGWMYDHNVRWISTERPCYSRIHGYCGTSDGVCRLDSCTDRTCCPTEFKDRLSLADWKTSNALRVSYLWQAAAYVAAIEEESPSLVIEDRWINRLDKVTAELDPWHAEGRELFELDFQGFLNCLSMKRSLDAVEDRVSEIRSARTAERRRVAKEAKDKDYEIQCADFKNYKGSRRKVGCNGTQKMCAACTTLFVDKHSN